MMATAIGAAWERAVGCPKRMAFGPCGGVERTGRCEAEAMPCVYLERPLRFPPAAAPTSRVMTDAGAAIAEIAAKRALVFTGFPVPQLRSDMVAPVAEHLLGSVDAVLCGDAGNSRTQFSPSYRAALISRTGLRVWNGFNARDRNRDALWRELCSLRAIGVAGVHCVTGDHTSLGDRPDAAPVFDMESTTMIPNVRSLGLLASFAESPAAPPLRERPARVAAKQCSGGQFAMLQYAGDVVDVARFVGGCVDAGASVPIIAGVPLVLDIRGAELLAGFQAARLPTGMLGRITGASDPERAGVEFAIDYGRRLLEIDGIGGVLIAGAAAPDREVAFARAQATVAQALGGGS